MKTTFAFLCGVLAVAAASCGGGGKCGSAAGCGGDIVGTWKITSSCITVDTAGMDVSMDCPGETVSPSGFSVTGTATYSANGTYSASTTITGSVVLGIPASCLSQGGLTLTCAQVNELVQGEIGGASPFQSATCTGSGSCTCVLTMKPQSSTTTGTYSTSGSILTEMSADDPTPSMNNYCATGTTLTLSPTAMTQMMDGTSGTITLTKQ